MANIIVKMDEDTCPVVSGIDLGTWLQMVYKSEAEYRSRYATTLTALQTGRALANEVKTVVNTIKTLANEVKTDSTTNAAAALAQKTASLNCSFTKPAMVIGSTASINARANAATITGIIDGVWYACAAAEAAFSSPADSFAPAATIISRNYTLSFTASGTLTHSTGATISGTAVAPEIPALTASTFPVAVMKIVLKAGTATRFNAGTTTLGAPGLTTTFTEYSYIPEWITSHAPALSAAAITAVQNSAMSTPGAALTSGNALLTLDIDETAITW